MRRILIQLLIILPALWFFSGSPDAAAHNYILGAGDKLRIKVHEWPDLSGQYIVGPSSTVSLPVIGEIDVADMTARELSQTISKSLRSAAKLSGNPSCSVEIVEFRPFFILGDVKTPGEYNYRPGLSVQQAVSIAGGYYRPAETTHRLDRDAITAKGEILIRVRETKQLAATIARLKAEQSNATEIKFPPELDDTPGSPDRLFMDQERAILTANNDSLKKTLKTLERYVTLYEQEIGTVKLQIESENRQLEAAKTEAESVEKLAEKGLTSLNRRLSAERALAQIESTIQGLKANILRAQQNISQTEQRRLDVLSKRTERINDALSSTYAKAMEAEYKLKTARELLLEAEVIAPALLARDQLSNASLKFHITRRENDMTVETQVDANARLLPADVLTVERRPTPQLRKNSVLSSASRKNVSN